jgi:hypothetical protein
VHRFIQGFGHREKPQILKVSVWPASTVLTRVTSLQPLAASENPTQSSPYPFVDLTHGCASVTDRSFDPARTLTLLIRALEGAPSGRLRSRFHVRWALLEHHGPSRSLRRSNVLSVSRAGLPSTQGTPRAATDPVAHSFLPHMACASLALPPDCAGAGALDIKWAQGPVPQRVPLASQWWIGHVSCSEHSRTMRAACFARRAVFNGSAPDVRRVVTTLPPVLLS